MSKYEFIVTKKIKDIGVMFLNRAPVNALSGDFRTQIHDCLQDFIDDESVKAIVVTTKNLPFSAGADIKEFSQGFKGKNFIDLYRVIKSSCKPIICGISNYALGGGLEFAMLCHYRVALDSANLGQVEIRLGLIPGGTGTQSLPRLIGVEKALDMILTGKPINALKGYEYGLIDMTCKDSLLDNCILFAEKILVRKNGFLPVPLDRDNKAIPDNNFFKNYKKSIVEKSKGLPAVYRAINCVEASITMSVEQGINFEMSQFIELVTGPDSAGMRYAFFAERAARNVSGIDKSTDFADIKSVGIVGGGLMGSGIAMAFVNRDIKVIIVEVDKERSDFCLQGLRSQYDKLLEKGKIDKKIYKQRLSSITVVNEMKALTDCCLVIEAVFEQMDIKEKVFKELDKICKPETILVSNTSGLDVNKLASVTSRPGKVMGLHFFSPAHIMKLVEVVRADKTDANTLATILSLAKKLKKIAVTVRVCPGFVGNRTVVRYFQQVEKLLLHGLSPEKIDKALTDFGFPMGPCQMADMAGLQISVHMIGGENLSKAFVDAGRLGQKNCLGFYDYEKGSNKPINSKKSEEIIQKYAKKKAVAAKDFTHSEIVDRCVFALILEGSKILEDSIVDRASDIDVVYCYGYGFPIARGGPMFYADQVGLDKIVKKINLWAKDDPALWKMSDLLKQDKKISQFFRSK